MNCKICQDKLIILKEDEEHGDKTWEPCPECQKDWKPHWRPDLDKQQNDQALIDKWKKEVYDDPTVSESEEYHFESLATGFFMAHGKTCNEAYDLYQECIVQGFSVSSNARDDQDTFDAILALDDDPELQGLNPVDRVDAIAKKVNLTDEQRREMKEAAIAGLNAWKEVRDGVPCEKCNGKAEWLPVKAAYVDKEGLGWDCLPFKCPSCKYITERYWRAPALDGKTKVKPYITKYEESESGGIVIKGFIKLEDM